MLRLALLPLLAGLMPSVFASPSSPVFLKRDAGTSTVQFCCNDPAASPPENMFVTGNISALGGYDMAQAPTMSPMYAQNCQYGVSLPLPADTAFQYSYFIRTPNATVIYDNKKNRTDTSPPAGTQQTLDDTWCQSPADCPEPGSDASLLDLVERGDAQLVPTIFLLSVQTQPTDNVFVYGNLAELGNNNADQAMTMSPDGNNQYRISIPLPASTTFQYQYYIKQTDDTMINDKAGQRTDTTPASGTQTLHDTFCTDAAQCPTGLLRRQASGQHTTQQFIVMAPTQSGDQVFIMGTPEEMGGMDPNAALTMHRTEPSTPSQDDPSSGPSVNLLGARDSDSLSGVQMQQWQVTTNLPADTSIVYRYFYNNAAGSHIGDDHPDRSLKTAGPNQLQSQTDSW